MTWHKTFLVFTPWFGQRTISFGRDKTLSISTITGGDRDNASYVQELKINGKPSIRSWVTWEDVFANGGTLDFVLGTNKVKWSTGDLLPSPASGEMPS
jgi:putative alpha-1,2-mannosidase